MRHQRSFMLLASLPLFHSLVRQSRLLTPTGGTVSLRFCCLMGRLLFCNDVQRVIKIAHLGAYHVHTMFHS